MNRNGQKWYTKSGEPIQAHGGMILKYEEKYYWYGENKGAPNVDGLTRVDFIGISCYVSDNLFDWEYLGLALEAELDKNSYLHPSRIIERPKVLYNKVTKKFIMWFHYDTADYLYAGAGVAVSETPQGPFQLVKVIKPNRKDCRDMTLFEEDGKGYLIHSSDFNKTLYISELTEDYQGVTGLYTKMLIDQEREAPTIFKANNYYFMITSGCSGWSPNAALYSRTPHLFSPAKLIDNPCEGPNYRKTFNGQGTFVFEHNGDFYLMLDHWVPTNLQDSGYSVLPISVSNREITVSWTELPFIRN
ncbi:glycosyl hydrolase family 43 [Niallia circulans]|uniref:glycoside hydrolase family 43 protein n=1 Tax=Niallia circulans TaxID=1397 RepID=UPI000BA6FED1|nr:glycoside hydrolase family 43 protein [Niallia circulans]PAE12242.1 glycosyl hydrolase family 43 [Niallia circulans]